MAVNLMCVEPRLRLRMNRSRREQKRRDRRVQLACVADNVLVALVSPDEELGKIGIAFPPSIVGLVVEQALG